MKEGRDDFNVSVGAEIRRARNDRGWTQAELADRAGIHPNYAARLERGELCPSLHIAYRLSLALGIPVGRLVGETVPFERGFARSA